MSLNFSVTDEYSPHPRSFFDWNVYIVFDVENANVQIEDRWGNGTPCREYQGIDIVLARIKGAAIADFSSVVEFLSSQEAQDLLSGVSEGHEVVWDGSNRVGKLSGEAFTSLNVLQEKVLNLAEYLPTYWSAEEWFSGCINVDLTGEETDEDLEDKAFVVVSEALPGYYLDRLDVLSYLQERRDLLRS